jgi:hypothetical protein
MLRWLLVASAGGILASCALIADLDFSDQAGSGGTAGGGTGGTSNGGMGGTGVGGGAAGGGGQGGDEPTIVAEWLVTLGGTGDDEGQTLTTMPGINDVLVAGSFGSDMAYLGIPALGAGGVYLARLDGRSGAMGWTRFWTTGNTASAGGVTVQQNDIIELVAFFTGSLAPEGIMSISTAVGQDMFFARLTADGLADTAVVAGGSGNDRVATGATAASNGFASGGTFNVDFAVNGHSVTATDGEDGWVARRTPGLTPGTTYLGAILGAGAQKVRAVTQSGDDLLAVGTTQGEATVTTTINPGAALVIAPMAEQGVRGYWARFGEDGAVIDAMAFGGAAPQQTRDVVAMSGSTFAVVGDFGNTISFNGGDLESGGGGFVALLQPDGTALWTAVVPGAEASVRCATEGTVAGAPTLVIGGTYDAELSIDGVALPEPADVDGFVAGLDPDTGTMRWALPLGGANDDFVHDVAVDDGGHVVAIGTFSTEVIVGGLRTQSFLGSDGFVVKLTIPETP